MGKVFLCEDLHRPEGQRLVAVKVLKEAEDDSAVRLEALVREFKRLRRLQHPNIVQVFESGTWRAGKRHRFWFSMEALEGNHLLEYDWDDYREVAFIVVEICRGLDAIHRNGYVHGDIKPQNLFVMRVRDPREEETGWRRFGYPTVKILDFGLCTSKAKALGGSPHYIAPEAALAQLERGRSSPDIGPRADLYSLGCVLYHLLAGREPYRGEREDAIYQAHMSPTKDPPALSVHLPSYLRELVHWLMKTEPNARPSSASEVVTLVRDHVTMAAADSFGRAVSFALATRFVPVEILPDGSVERLAKKMSDSTPTPGPSIYQDGRRLYVLTAPSGWGKSHFLSTLKSTLSDKGVELMRLRGSDEGFSRLAKKLAAFFDLEFDREHFAKRYPHLAAAPVRDPAANPLELIGDNLAAAISDAAMARRFVIAVDDAQQADEHLLKLLVDAAKSPRTSPVRFLIVANPDAARSPEDFRRFLDTEVVPQAQVLKLQALDRPKIENLLHDVFLADPSPGLVEHIHQASEGVPQAVAAITHHLSVSGRLETLETGGLPVVTLRSSRERDAEPLLALIRGVSTQERALLELLACLRHDVTIVEIAAMLKRLEGPAESPLQDLVRRGLVSQTSGTKGSFRLVGVVREVVLRDVSPKKVEKIHRVIAAATEDSADQADRAQHLWLSGQRAEAAALALRVAREKRATYRLTQVIEMANIVIGWYESLRAKPKDDATRMYLESLMLKGATHFERGHVAAAEQAFQTASETASRSTAFRSERVDALLRLAEAKTGYRSAASDKEAAELLAQAKGLASQGLQGYPELLDQVLETTARLLKRSGRLDAAIPALEQLHALRLDAHPLKRAITQIDLGECRAFSIYCAEPFDEVAFNKAVELIETGLETAEDQEDRATAAAGNNSLGRVLIWVDRFQRARVHLQRAMDLYGELSYTRRRTKPLLNLVLLTSHTGPFDRTSVLADEAFEWHRGRTRHIEALKALTFRTRARFFRGDYADALFDAREVLDTLERADASGAGHLEGRQLFMEAKVIEAQILGEIRSPLVDEAFVLARRGEAMPDHMLAYLYEGIMRLDRLRGSRQEDPALVPLLERAIRESTGHGQVIYPSLAEAALAEALSIQKAALPARISSLAAGAVKRVAVAEIPLYQMEVLHYAARAEMEAGGLRVARQYCQQALEQYRSWRDQNVGCVWRVHALRAQIALEFGQRVEAAEAAWSATDILERLGSRLSRHLPEDAERFLNQDPVKKAVLDIRLQLGEVAKRSAAP